MGGKAYGNEYRATVVCVDTYCRGAVSGRLYNPYLPDGAEFASLLDFFRQMEDLLDAMQFPQSFTAARRFSQPPPRPERTPGTAAQEGGAATFLVRVLFRQNASWQGSVAWLEGRREESFRSALELVLLMDSALRNGEKGEKP